ncbi:MAG: tetratricopeptide repeat protein, partial [Desulfosporosinus sp.]|nr:tetratricopeptide repeat protein [Desulfosporosinus sp.]
RKEIDDKTGEDGYEDWEDDYELISKGDYEGLKMLRQMIAKNNPEDIHAQWRLGEAYVLCKEYEKAIDYLRPLYRNNPDNEDIEHSILDALFASGKSERDYKWVSAPKILRLNKEISDFCYDYLKVKRKGRELDDVFCQLLVEGYLTFNEEELLHYLNTDGRFEFQNNTYVHSTLLSVKKKEK